MAMEMTEFKFPDEPPEKDKPAVEQLEVEIEDDTPVGDQNREPMPTEVVKELEDDDLEEYSDKVKTRLKQMKKVWHDERRAKEAAYREQQEAINYAKRVSDENKKLKEQYSAGEKEFVEAAKSSAALKIEVAKKAFREAYDSGDSERLVEAQVALNEATLELNTAKNFKPAPLQPDQNAVQHQQVPQQTAPRPDQRAMAWQERNPWFGANRVMTSLALGLHEQLKEDGVVIGSDDYYNELDKTIRKRFPEQFGDAGSQTNTGKEPPRTKPGTVVAPATRSTSSNKVKLRASQVQLAKRLGLTPEQYAREVIKLENQNG